MKRNAKDVLKKSLVTTLSAAMVLGTVFVHLPTEVDAATTTEKIAIASATAKSYGPSGDGDSIMASFDGNTTTYTNSNYLEPNGAGALPQVYTITLAETVKLNKVRIHPRNAGGNVGNGAPNRCVVSVSKDGSSYTQLKDSAVATSLTWTDITFVATDAKYVKLDLYSDFSTNVVSTGEVELYKEVVEDTRTEEEKLRDQIAELVEQVNAKYVKGEYTFSVDQSVNTALKEAEKRLADPNASIDKLTWGVTYLQRALDAMNKPTNKLSAIEKEIYNMIVAMEETDTTQYTEDSWAAYVATCNSARGKVNGTYSDADMQKELDAMKAAFAALVKVDMKLAELKKLAAEKSAVKNDGYTRESWRALQNAIYAIEDEARKSNAAISDETYNTLKGNLETAFAGLVKGGEGTETGNNDAWGEKERYYHIKGGQLYVSGEVPNGDGTTTLTVTWINDGLDPETGGLMYNDNIFNKPEWSTRPFTKDDWSYVKWLKVSTTTDGVSKTLRYDGTSGPIEDIADCNGFAEDQRAGFTREITVPTGSAVKLELSGFDSARNKARTYSLGVYQTKKVEEDTIAPVITVGEESSYFGTAVEVTDNFKLTEVKINDEAQKVSGKTWSDKLPGMAEEETTYVITAKDSAGNVAETKTVTIKKFPSVDDVELTDEFVELMEEIEAELAEKEESGYYDDDPEALEEAKDAMKALEDRYVQLAYEETIEIVEDLLDMDLPAAAIPDLEDLVDGLEEMIKEAGDILTDEQKDKLADLADKVQDKIDELNEGKKALDDKIDELSKLPTDKYTDASAKALEEALKEAKEVADNEFSTAGDYKDALAQLEKAEKGLKEKDTATDKPNKGDKPNKPNKPNKPGTKPNDKKNNDAVKTGDTAPIMLWTVMGMLAVIAAAFAAMKKRRLG